VSTTSGQQVHDPALLKDRLEHAIGPNVEGFYGSFENLLKVLQRLAIAVDLQQGTSML